MRDEGNRTAPPVAGGEKVRPESLPEAMKRIKRTIIEDTLAAYGGNRTHTARRQRLPPISPKQPSHLVSPKSK